jgi:hypothetical protein
MISERERLVFIGILTVLLLSWILIYASFFHLTF